MNRCPLLTFFVFPGRERVNWEGMSEGWEEGFPQYPWKGGWKFFIEKGTEIWCVWVLVQTFFRILDCIRIRNVNLWKQKRKFILVNLIENEKHCRKSKAEMSVLIQSGDLFSKKDENNLESVMRRKQRRCLKESFKILKWNCKRQNHYERKIADRKKERERWKKRWEPLTERPYK